MKKLVLCILALSMALSVHGQKSEEIKPKKLTKEAASEKTSEQRLVHESERKSKGKRNLSVKKKVKIEEKQNRRVQHVKPPKKKKVRH